MRYLVIVVYLIVVSSPLAAQSVYGRTAADSARLANMPCRHMDSVMAVCPQVSEPSPPPASVLTTELAYQIDTTARDTSGTEAWLALPAGRYYYRASCQAAKELPNAVRFLSADEAEAYGLRRSRVPGC